MGEMAMSSALRARPCDGLTLFRFEMQPDFRRTAIADAQAFPATSAGSSAGSKTAERALTHFVIAVRVALIRGVFRLSL